MSLESVKAFFRLHGMEDRVISLSQSTATVSEAAMAHDVEPGQIGKTLSFKIKEEPLLILVAGDKKIDNKKYKAQFGAKAKMLSPDEALAFTGHAVGGICPFGLKNEIPVYLDASLKAYEEIIPAAGDRNSAIRLSIDEVEKYSGFKIWVDVCK